MIWLFGHGACGILTPRPEIEPPLPALEGEVLTTGPPGKSLGCTALDKSLHIYDLTHFFLCLKNCLFIWLPWLQHVGSLLHHAGPSLTVPGLSS